MYINKKGGVLILCCILDFTVARIINSSSEFDSIENSNHIDNYVDFAIDNFTDYYNYVDSETKESEDDWSYELECELSEMPPEPDSKCCGIDVSMNDRIVGGSPTLLKQYPWMALIEYKVQGTSSLQLKCGGSLISGLYVLTAGHCVTGSIRKKSTPVNVVLGDYDKYHDGQDCIQENNGKVVCSEGEVRIGIAKITPHQFYEPISFDNDIALIKLNKMAPYTDFIRPICLPTSDLTKTNHRNLWLTLAGWGVMKQEKVENKYTGESSNVKRELRMPYVPAQICKRSWIITEYHICAGGLKGQDACMGDSGGPLMFNNDGQFELAGAVSFGAGAPCGKDGTPGVYTNIFKYYDWIINVIKDKKKAAEKKTSNKRLPSWSWNAL